MSDRTQALAIAVLCILALGLAAATLTSPVETGGDSGEAEAADSDSAGGSGNTTHPAERSLNTSELSVYENEDLCHEPLVELPIWLVLAVVALLIVGIVTLAMNVHWAIILAGIAVGPMVVLFLVFTAGCAGTPPAQSAAEQAATDTGGELQEAVEGVGDGDVSGLSVSTPTLLVGGFVTLTVVGLLASLLLSEDEEEESDDLPDFDQPPPRAIGRVAGEVADEIESDVGLHNGVYRAWGEMAGALEVDHPNRSTPAEFAEAAHEAGISPDDVRELTAVFEEVRYGEADPTDEREQRAVEALRRIERTYAAEESDDGGAAGL